MKGRSVSLGTTRQMECIIQPCPARECDSDSQPTVNCALCGRRSMPVVPMSTGSHICPRSCILSSSRSTFRWTRSIGPVRRRLGHSFEYVHHTASWAPRRSSLECTAQEATGTRVPLVSNTIGQWQPAYRWSWTRGSDTGIVGTRACMHLGSEHKYHHGYKTDLYNGTGREKTGGR